MPEGIDASVTDETPVRFLAADVESRALERRGVARAQAALMGRPADEPRDVLQRYIDGDLHRRRSSRRLERDTPRHVELIWLLRTRRPDFKTMADFRNQHTKALHALFRECVLLCKPLALFGAERLAIAGSKLKAVNRQHQNVTKATLEKALQDIDEQGAKDLRDRAAADREASRVHQPTREELPQKIARLQARQQRYHGVVQAITASGETQLSLTDPDRRSMPKSPKVDVGYHVQIAVDRQHQLLVEQEVTKAVTDDEQLSPLALRAKETLGVERLRAVADMGDSHGHESKAGDEAGIDAYVPTPSTSAHTQLGLCGKERFTDAPQQACYRCPQGADLTFRCATTERGRPLRYYATSACRSGPMKEQCTRNNAGRRITRWVDEPMLERMEERRKANPESMQERQQRVEHPFGTIKHATEQGYFLVKGLKTVRAEFRLSCLADNLTRVINILGVPRRLVALG